MGAKEGLQAASPIFQECFEDFIVKLDSLHLEKKEGIPRRRSIAIPGEHGGGSSSSLGPIKPSRSSDASMSSGTGMSFGTSKKLTRMHSN